MGAAVGADRGLESEVAHRYQEHLDQGALALVARVRRRDAPFARGVFIESVAFDIRNVEGSFIAREGPATYRAATDRPVTDTKVPGGRGEAQAQ